MQETYTGLEDLPPTPFEVDTERHRIVTEQNARRERIRLRKANAKKGFAEPKVGEVLHIQLDGTITRRTRGGVRFERGQRIPVTVVDMDPDRLRQAQMSGQSVTDIAGAERIIEDTMLHVYRSAGGSADQSATEAKLAAVEEELRITRADLARAREARMEAIDKGDGSPARLAAARKVAAAAGKPPAAAGATEVDHEFGAQPTTPPTTK
jgi:hypothetical protein